MKVRFKACLVSRHRKLIEFMTTVIKVEVVIKSCYLLFWVLVFSDNKIIIERPKLLFLGSSVNDNNDVFILFFFS